jgi:transcriptional regulator with XRE-family HTH domain
MGQLYDILENHMNQSGYRISQRQVAYRLGVSPTTLKNWQSPRELIEKRHLVAIAELTGVPYHRVLDALLNDIGYLRESDEPPHGQSVAR